MRSMLTATTTWSVKRWIEVGRSALSSACLRRRANRDPARLASEGPGLVLTLPTRVRNRMAEPRRTITADPGDLKGVRILVVEARFYDDIAEELLKGATAVLDAAGAVYDRLTVPGSLEIPPAITIALDAAERAGKPYEGAVALGCVIRGDTIHFEIVSFESSRGLMEISRTRGVPIGNGIVTVDNDAQAWMRAKVDQADKGGDAAHAALALVRLKRRLAAG